MNTTTKAIQFDKLIPNLKHFTTDKNREVLKYAYYDGENLYATDSHRLIKIKGEYVEGLPSADPFFFNPKTREVFDSDKFNYPEVNRLFPTTYNTSIVIDNEKEFKKQVSSVHEVAKQIKNKMSTLQITRSNVTLSAYREESEAIEDVDGMMSGDDLTISFNNMYMKQVLQAVGKLKQKNSKIRMYFTGKMRPITITDDEVFNIMLMPVRPY